MNLTQEQHERVASEVKRCASDLNLTSDLWLAYRRMAMHVPWCRANPPLTGLLSS